MKIKQTILALVLILGMVSACLPMMVSAQDATQGRWSDYADTSFAGGSGTEADPYQIATASQLAKLANEVNSGEGGKTHSGEYFILTNDIDLSDHIWTPLGYETYDNGGGSSQPFTGYFDGNNKKITGLYVDEREGDSSGKNRSAGLFGCVVAISNEPIIQNLTVENGTVLAGDGDISYSETYGAGLLVGNITVSGGSNVDYAVIQNCTVSGTVESTKRAGGLVGHSSYTHFENCLADAKVVGIAIYGGFVGDTFESQFIDCIATGDVPGKGFSAGGFAGILFHNTTVKHCAAWGDVEASDWNLGGFAGYAENNVVITNSIARGNVTSTVTQWDPRTGGFLGMAWDSSVKLEKCHASGNVTVNNTGSIGGFIGTDHGSEISVVGCSFDRERNALIPAVGNASVETYEITPQSTANIKADICNSYYGGHDMVRRSKLNPTCTADGIEAGNECAHCGYTEGFSVIKATGHTGGTATCSTKAKCTVCNEEYGEFDPKAHTELKHTDAKAATADAEGNIEYWYCADCGKYYSDKDGVNEITQADTVTAKLKNEPEKNNPEKNNSEKNNPSSPPTDDKSNLALWIALMFVSSEVAIGTTVISKKKKHSK